MNTFYTVLSGIAGFIIALAGIVYVVLRHLNAKGGGVQTVQPTPSSDEKKSGVPSVYTVRANRLFLARRRIIPRLIMWGVVVGAVACALYLFNPNMFSYTIKAVGPSIGIALMGFAVLGIGQSMEETHESYEFSRLGWGGAFVLWIIAFVTLFKLFK